MEIKVVVPDAFAASDLTWLLSSSTRVSRAEGVDGKHVVYIESSEDARPLIDEIRNWAALQGVAPVVVHVGDGAQRRVSEF